MAEAPPARPVGLILAGGRARRLGGGEKALYELAGRPLLDHVIPRIRPQVSTLLLNVNGDPARFAAWGLPILSDPLPDHPGPLAGILAGLRWVAAQGEGSGADASEAAGMLVTVPTDAPFLPLDLVARLSATRRQAGAPIACARSGGGRLHPVIALWSASLAPALAAALAQGLRKVEQFCAQHGAVAADFDDAVWDASRPGGLGGDPFFNVNSPADLAAAEARLGAGGAGPDARP